MKKWKDQLSIILLPEEQLDTKDHYSYIVWVYFIWIVLYVLGHSHPVRDTWPHWCTVLTGWIYTFHMPLFFFINGFLLVHSRSIDRLGYGAWILGKVVKLGVPYLVLTVVAYVPKMLLGGASEGSGLGYLLNSLFLNPRNGVWGHFWQLYALLILEAIWGIWRAGRKNWIFLLAGFLFSLFMSCHWIRSTLFCLEDLSFVSIFYVFGILTALIRPVLWDRPWKNLLAILLCAVVCRFTFSFGNYWVTDQNVFNFINALLLVWIAWNVGKLISVWKNRIVSGIVPWCFPIFIYSWPCQAVLDVVLRALNVNFNQAFVAMFIAGFALPLLLVYYYRKFRWCHCGFLDYLFGVRTITDTK